MPERCKAFTDGLESQGYEVIRGYPVKPGPDDVFVTWNRIGTANKWADKMQTLVVENATWGNDFCGQRWYHIAKGRHNTAGRFPVGGNDRWDRLGVELEPFRTEGETVILAQRGIGSAPTKMPANWYRLAGKRHNARIRKHPGTRPCKPLRDDLAQCRTVVTWGSGAAIHALMWGCHVISDMPDWIGEQDNTEAGRLDMFRRLAWAQWTLDEIAEGKPFRKLLTG